jgi:uncharacterized protein YwgA
MDEPEELYGSDLVLLLLAAPTAVPSAAGRINGITRLEKLLYLAEKETDVGKAVSHDPLSFVAYDYGPFSKDVYEAVDLLEDSGLVTEEQAIDGQSIDGVADNDVTGTTDQDEYIERRFALTDSGKSVAALLARQYPSVVTTLSSLKNTYAERHLSSLIRYVYTTYPESAVNSKIAHRFS